MSKASRTLALAAVPHLLEDMARRHTGNSGVLSAERVNLLDQTKVWPSRRGDLPIGRLSRGHAENAASWLGGQAPYLCYHYWAAQISDPDAGDETTEDALAAMADPVAWLWTMPLMGALRTASLVNRMIGDR